MLEDALALVVAGASALFDLRPSSRVPNALTFGTLACAIAISPSRVLALVCALACVGAALLVERWRGWMFGGADLKLFAAFGAALDVSGFVVEAVAVAWLHFATPAIRRRATPAILAGVFLAVLARRLLQC